MIGKNVLAALAIGACVSFGASLSAADGGAAAPASGLLSNGHETFVDFSLKMRSVDWDVKEVRNSAGKFAAPGSGLTFSSTAPAVEYGRRARNSWGYSGTLSLFGMGTVQPTLNGRDVGADADSSGMFGSMGVAGALHYSRDLWGKDALNQFVIGYDLGGRMTVDYTNLKNDTVKFRGQLTDWAIRPSAGGFFRYDTGTMTWQGELGLQLDMPLYREFKNTSSGSAAGNIGSTLKPDSPMGFYLGGALRWDRYVASIRIEGTADFSVKFGFALLF